MSDDTGEAEDFEDGEDGEDGQAQATDKPETPAGQRKRIKFEQEQSRLFWQQVFAHPAGRREMWAILQNAHAFEERFACGPNGFPQPEATWFHAGEQAYGQRLFQSWLALEPSNVTLMLFEHDPRFPKPTPQKRKRGQG